MSQKASPERADSEPTVPLRTGLSREVNLARSRVLRSGFMALVGFAVFAVPALASEPTIGNSNMPASDATLPECGDRPLLQSATEAMPPIPYHETYYQAGLECVNPDGSVFNRPNPQFVPGSESPAPNQIVLPLHNPGVPFITV